VSLERPITKQASLTPLLPNGQRGESVKVHFNPVSLQYQVSNTLEKRGQGNQAHQYVSQSSAKLTMDLVFDTTISGKDVRATTQKIAQMMKPNEDGDDKVPSKVEFEWGAYKFEGMLEQYKETLDFFSPDGVPLRSTINLTLTAQDRVFAPSGTGPRQNTSGSLTPDTVTPPNTDGSVAQLANQAGYPKAARAIGNANGVDSLRAPAGGGLSLPAGPNLRGPAAFASGGFGAAAGGGFGAGIGGGFGAAAGGGFGAAAGGGFGAAAGGGFGAAAGGGFGAAAGGGFGAAAGGGFGAAAGGGFGAAAGGGFGAAAGGGFGAAAGGGFGAAAGGGFGAAAGGSFGAAAGGSFGAVAGGSFGAAAGGSFSASAGGSFSATAGGSFNATAGGSFTSSSSSFFAASATASGAFGTVSYSASYGGATFGGRASAGVPASFGAFAGLRAPEPYTGAFDARRLLPPARPFTVSASVGAEFDLGGRAVSAGSAGLSTDVGRGASLSARIRFQEG
jgi:hypothetical protein